MASIHRRPRSPYWHAAFRGPDGRLVLRSTKQTDRNKAMAMAIEFERAANLAKRGELVEAQAREIVADMMKRAGADETLRTVSITEYFRHWLATKEARKSAGTAERYGTVVDRFLAGLGKRADRPLTALVAKDVDAFLNARLKQGISPSTACLDVKIIRTALKAAQDNQLIPTNPAKAVELPDAYSVERSTFTAAEVNLLVDTAAGEWKTLIMLGYFTGRRLGDCCRMTWDMVDLTKGTLTITDQKTKRHGGKETVPLHPDLLAHLEDIAGKDTAERFIVPGIAAQSTTGRRGHSETFKAIVRKAGLDLQAVKGGGNRMISKRSFHALRHSYVSGLHNNGVSEALAKAMTGHKSSAIHARYTHHELEPMREAIAKLPGLKAAKAPALTR